MRLALAACLILFAGCEFVPVPLPTASATMHFSRLDLPRASYCWSSGGKATCADSAPPGVLVANGYLRPYRTAGGYDVQVAFQSKSQLRGFHVELVMSPSGTAAVNTTGDKTFGLPVAPGVPAGIYVYMISSTWPEGSVSFFLPIDLAPGVA